jgi:D-xylose reductase
MVSPTLKLNSGYEMPIVGFGLWKVNNDTCADQVYEAIKAGYRLFDGACGEFQPELSLHGGAYGNREA